MKKTIICLMAAAAVSASCMKDENPIQSSENNELVAKIEQMASSKTYIDEDRNVLWSAGDQISAFMKTTLMTQYQVADESVGKPSARFTKVAKPESDDLYAGTPLEHNVVYYPYQEDLQCMMSDGNYTMALSLPAVQTYQEGSFGVGAFPMVAISSNNEITFKNLCGGIRFQFTGIMKVASLEIVGANGEKMSGAAVVTAYSDGSLPAVTMGQDAGTSVILDCGKGVQLNAETAADFIVALPPMSLPNGFTVLLTDSVGRVYSIKSTAASEIVRSALMVMPVVEIESPAADDYVDEYGVNHGKGVAIDGVVWAPVNCGYKAAEGEDKGYVYGKLYQWGRHDGQGYSDVNVEEEEYPQTRFSDETYAMIFKGPVSLEEVDDYSDYYINSDTSDWLSQSNDDLWHSVVEGVQVKTEYDPCPAGWRVPTSDELSALCANGACNVDIESSDYSATEMAGYWFSGSTEYAEGVPAVFLPFAGSRMDGVALYRNQIASYWTSTPYTEEGSKYLAFDISGYSAPSLENANRATAMSVRCVLITD